MSTETSRLSTNRRALILSYLRAHPVRSGLVIGLFLIYLPIVYQIHLNLVAAHVGVWAGHYSWATMGYSLFPFPFDVKWLGSGVAPAITPLSPIEVYIYATFYPSIAPRVMWSVLWLTIGFTYIIWPLLSSPKTKDAAVSTTLD